MVWVVHQTDDVHVYW